MHLGPATAAAVIIALALAATACHAILSPMAQATLHEAHRVHVARAQKHGFGAMSLEEMRTALARLMGSRDGPQLPPATILHPWNPGARCVPKSELVGEVDPVCLDVTEYDTVYADDFTPIRNQIANGAAALLFVAGGAECSIASAWAVCPAMVSPCLPDVPVPGSGGEVVALNVPTCLHLCDLILDNCIDEMINIFSYDNATAHATLRCAQPHGNPLFYGNTTYDIFPAAADHSVGNNTVTQFVAVTLEDGEGANGSLTPYSFEHTHECYDATIGNAVNLGVLNCPSGLVRDRGTGFCHFKCPEPLVSSSDYDALKALVTLGACLSVLALTVAIATYCIVPVLRPYPDNLAMPLFLSLLGIALSLLLGAVDDYHEGAWCSDSGSPNEWGAGTCTVQGIGIVYFSYSSALWWFAIVLHLTLARGIPTLRRPKQSTDTSATTAINLSMRTQRRYLSFRIPFEWVFSWARRSSERVYDERGSSGSDSDEGRVADTITEWPSLPRCLQRKLERGALGVRVYAYTLLAHVIAWGVPVIPVVIGLSAKRIGYGGADLWCTVHSGADISFRVTTDGGVAHDQEHDTNPWLLGLYIAPIFAILVVGSLLVCVAIGSGCVVMGHVLYKYRSEGFVRNVWAFVNEWARQIRLLIFSGTFLVVFLLQQLWLTYFSAIRPEQYDKFSAYILCSFRAQGPTEHAPQSCSLERIINAEFWGFTALLFASIGVPVAIVFLARPEPIRWCWYMVRYRRAILTESAWEKYVDQSSHRTSSGGSDTVSSRVPGRKLTEGEASMRREGALGGAVQFDAARKKRAKREIRQVRAAPESDIPSSESDIPSSESEGSEPNSEESLRMERLQRTGSTLIHKDGVMTIADDGEGGDSGSTTSSDGEGSNLDVITISD